MSRAQVCLVSTALDASTLIELRKAAMAGDAESQHRLGWLYYSGKGVKPDYDQAARWWSQAASQGSVVAKFDLSVMFRRDSEGVYHPVMPWAVSSLHGGH